MDLRTDVPHSARIYDYLLGGKDNFQADRDAAGGITQDWPHLAISMRANRNFMARIAHFIAAELGIRQFLDIGTGLPTSPNLHEVVQAVDPASRVVYVDNDPIVLVHARALLTSTAEGRTAYIDADLHDPSAILAAPQLTETLDLSRPVSLSLIAVLQFIVDEVEVHRIIDALLAPLPSGSVLALSTVTADSAPDEVNRGVAAYVARGISEKARDHAQVVDLFGGLDAQPLHGRRVVVDLLALVQVQRAVELLHVDHIGQVPLREPQDGERTAGRRVPAKVERDDLQADAGLLSRADQRHHLLAHDLQAADRAAQHGLVEYRPQLRTSRPHEYPLPLDAQLYPALDVLLRRGGVAEQYHGARVPLGL